MPGSNSWREGLDKEERHEAHAFALREAFTVFRSEDLGGASRQADTLLLETCMSGVVSKVLSIVFKS